MSALERWNWSLDGWIVVAGMFSAVAAAMLGNFLVLRKMSMLGDAISHAILPGLAAAFILSGSRSSLPMFLGAVVVGVLTAVFTEWIRGFGKVDEGASMGVVFTSLFALGLVMIVQAADHVDLDSGCVLYGAIELTPLDTWRIVGWPVPRVVVVLSIVVAVNLIFVTLFFKELKISSFDPALATTTGFNAGLMHYLLMALVALTAVASFESVGNILFVAMLVVPPAAAYMLTDRLVPMFLLSILLAALSAVLGHIGALTIPHWFGFRSTTTAGMMAVTAGAIFFLAALFGPQHGVVVKLVRRRILALRILAEDSLALLYRLEEQGDVAVLSRAQLRTILLSGSISTRLILTLQQLRRFIRWAECGYRLTDRGTQYAKRLVRSHRLWEEYLATRAGISSERIHTKAERLEHFTDRDLRDKLDEETEAPRTDPHGRTIPPEILPSPSGGDSRDKR